MNKKFLILLSMLLNFLTFGEVKKNYDCNFLTDLHLMKKTINTLICILEKQI